MVRYKPRAGIHWFDALCNIRCEAGMSRAELAAMVELSAYTIGAVERGEQQPSQALVDAYGRLARQQER